MSLFKILSEENANIYFSDLLERTEFIPNLQLDDEGIYKIINYVGSNIETNIRYLVSHITIILEVKIIKSKILLLSDVKHHVNFSTIKPSLNTNGILFLNLGKPRQVVIRDIDIDGNEFKIHLGHGKMYYIPAEFTSKIEFKVCANGMQNTSIFCIFVVEEIGSYQINFVNMLKNIVDEFDIN